MKESTIFPYTLQTQSPGRINLIGEHTDYNGGWVLPAAINKNTRVRIRRVDGDIAVVHAINLGESFRFSLAQVEPVAAGWPNYILGVVHELQQIGGNIAAFEAELFGDVPVGSGMSSSAALECALAFALNELFQLNFSRLQLIHACQKAEHHFVGIQCGIMDQFASVMGKKDQVLLLDCRSLDCRLIPLAPGHFDILLLNTNVAHHLAASEYNTRRAECEEGVHILQKRYPEVVQLRDVTLPQLLDSESMLPPVVFRRCLHVVTENERVIDAVSALEKSDFEQLGRLMYQSHDSLQRDYAVSCPELDFFVEEARRTEGVAGCRMMGGGFGGCAIHLIEQRITEQYIEQTARSYREKFGMDLSPYVVTIENGAGLC